MKKTSFRVVAKMVLASVRMKRGAQEWAKSRHIHERLVASKQSMKRQSANERVLAGVQTTKRKSGRKSIGSGGGH